MKCEICNKEIEKDSQFIEGKWFHNKCILNLQNRIDKAIEYIESHSPSDIGITGNGKKYYYTLNEDGVDNLLDILKGDDE